MRKIKDFFREFYSVIIAATLLLGLLTTCNYLLISKDKEMKTHIGEEVIIKNDTLIIISYSFFNEEYDLDNGSRISAEFLNNQNK